MRCMCSNNIDLSVTGNCNNVTGECLKCLYNTTGSQCQWCQAGTYGNAIVQGNCRGNNSSLHLLSCCYFASVENFPCDLFNF